YRPDPDAEPNVLVLEAAAPSSPPAAGVRVDFSRVPLTVNPLLCGIKSLNRLEQVLAAKELEGDLFEVLMSNAAGDIVEGTRTNLFV
ncbi:aminotransferase class IV, partial [Klebsiella pneumoniae]|uniref:aminotransferase class IV n=1 Tax=Klebsiella pneumoniae TaxID=573 RepID=UPI003013BA86